MPVPRPNNVPAEARRQPQHGYNFWIVGAERARLRDAYHSFLRVRWSVSIGLIAIAFMLVNVVFATVYYYVGGVEGLHPSSFFDALVFSVETIGTIGYGVMHPESGAANVVMIVESITGIIFTALVTGLVFAKFSRATARMQFSTNALITKHDGKLTLMFRCGNMRSNIIVDAHLRVVGGFKQVLAEGQTFYKLHDVQLVRDHMAGMRRGWLAMHVIDETSPFYQLDSAGLAEQDVELEISLMGLDDVTMQTVHAMHIYTDKQIKFGYRFEDIMTILPDGDILIDLTKFNSIVPDTTPRDSVAAT